MLWQLCYKQISTSVGMGISVITLTDIAVIIYRHHPALLHACHLFYNTVLFALQWSENLLEIFMTWLYVYIVPLNMVLLWIWLLFWPHLWSLDLRLLRISPEIAGCKCISVCSSGGPRLQRYNSPASLSSYECWKWFIFY